MSGNKMSLKCLCSNLDSDLYYVNNLAGASVTFMSVKVTLLANPKLDVVTKAVTTIRAIHTIVRASSSRVCIMHDNGRKVRR